MLALTFQGEKRICLSTVPVPVLVHETDVIVKVTLCGICGRSVHHAWLIYVLVISACQKRYLQHDFHGGIGASLTVHFHCSDLHPYHGRERGIAQGCIVGHEFVGEVVELGKKVCAGLLEAVVEV